MSSMLGSSVPIGQLRGLTSWRGWAQTGEMHGVGYTWVDPIWAAHLKRLSEHEDQIKQSFSAGRDQLMWREVEQALERERFLLAIVRFKPSERLLLTYNPAPMKTDSE